MHPATESYKTPSQTGGEVGEPGLTCHLFVTCNNSRHLWRDARHFQQNTYYTIQAIIKVLWRFIWLKAAQSWGCRLKVLMSRSGDIAVCVLITPIPFLFIYTTSESRCSSHLCAFQGEKQINTFLTCQGWERLPISPVWVFNTCQVGM